MDQNKLECLSLPGFIQPNIVFAGQASSLHYREGSALLANIRLELKRPARIKRPSLFGPSVSYREKGFITSVEGHH